MATKLNLFIDQGTDFSTTIEVADDAGTPINLTTYTGRSQMRKHYWWSIRMGFRIGFFWQCGF